jgi:hypothetical protein
MYGRGLGINACAVEQIQNHLQGKLTFELSSLLENLSDSNLIPKVELSVKPGGYTFSAVVSINNIYINYVLSFLKSVLFVQQSKNRKI